MISTTIISIVVISLAVLVWNKIFPLKICPICAGVSGTWLWMIAARIWGYDPDMLILGLLMGGSVVGIAYQLERKIPSLSFTPFFKMTFVPVGFLAVYGLIKEEWTVFIFGILFLLFILLGFIVSGGVGVRGQNQKKVGELEQKMKGCC